MANPNDNKQKIMGDAYRFVKEFKKSIISVLPKSSSKASPGKKLFYSPDYQTIYKKEIDEINLQLLNTAEMVLSNYDYRTIDSVNDSIVSISQNADGEFEIDFNPPEPTIFGAVSPSISNTIFGISEKVVSIIEGKLNNTLSYLSVLINYGKPDATTKLPSGLPTYDKSGKPTYDLYLTGINDSNGVIGYNIYMVKESDDA